MTRERTAPGASEAAGGERGAEASGGREASGVAVVGAVVIGITIYVLTGLLSFTADLDTSARVATSILGAAVLLALSPPSTIAVIKEVGARGRSPAPRSR